MVTFAGIFAQESHSKPKYVQFPQADGGALQPSCRLKFDGAQDPGVVDPFAVTGGVQCQPPHSERSVTKAVSLQSFAKMIWVSLA